MRPANGRSTLKSASRRRIRIDLDSNAHQQQRRKDRRAAINKQRARATVETTSVCARDNTVRVESFCYERAQHTFSFGVLGSVQMRQQVRGGGAHNGLRDQTDGANMHALLIQRFLVVCAKQSAVGMSVSGERNAPVPSGLPP